MNAGSFTVLASGDHHFDEHSRFSECMRVHAWMVDIVREQKPDVFLSAGDIYEAASTPIERAAVADWLRAIAEHCPVVAVKGNHDRPRDVELLSKLHARHPIIVEERAAVHQVGPAAIACLAWPSTASLAAMLGKPAAREESDAFASEMLQHVLRGLSSELDAHDGPKVLLSHCMIDGSVTSTGQPLIGQELRVGLEDLALARADITIAGHVHAPQAWPWKRDGIDTPILYTGSSYRTAYGETEQKSIVRARWDRGNDGKGRPDWKLAAWDRIATPATPMQLFEAEWLAVADPPNLSFPVHCYPNADRVRGAECRLRFRFPSDARDAAKRAAEAIREQMIADGALHVKLDEELVVVSRARAPEIATATTTREMLEALWRAHGTMPDDARKARLFAKLARLEAA